MPLPHQQSTETTLGSLSVPGSRGRFARSHSKDSPDYNYSMLSPQILRRTQAKLHSLQSIGRSFFGRSREEKVPPTLVAQLSFSVDDDATLDNPTPVSARAGTTGPVASKTSDGTKSSRLDLRKLRNRSAGIVSDQAGIQWEQMDECSWKNQNTGVVVQLHGRKLNALCYIERHALQKLALTRLQKMNLGCTVTKPKDTSLLKKRNKYVKKKAHTVNIVDRHDQSSSRSKVFGISIYECLQNDLKQTPLSNSVSNVNADSEQSEISLLARNMQDRCRSLDLQDDDSTGSTLTVRMPSGQRLSGDSGRFSATSKSSLSDQGSSTDSSQLVGTSKLSSLEIQSSVESTSLSFDRYSPSGSIDNIPLKSTSPVQFSVGPSSQPKEPSVSSPLLRQQMLKPRSSSTPKLVNDCCDYLRHYGLHTLGLFRVTGSVKRCREMREELDSGRENSVIDCSESGEHFPHDIATLLKEYFRDLPSPLLTKELYGAFVTAARYPENKRVEILRYLISLLPCPNMDTLEVLLQLLKEVANNSTDSITNDGISLSGNKMDPRNLATIFAPTILRPSSSKTVNNLHDSDAAITSLEAMINCVDSIFFVPANIQNDVYSLIQETDPDALDHILSRISRNQSAERNRSESTSEDCSKATVIVSSLEDVFSDQASSISDQDPGSMIKTKEIQTHKIVYRIKNYPGDSTKKSSSLDETPGHKTTPKTLSLEERFGDLKLFIDESPDPNPPTQDSLEPVAGGRRYTRPPLSPLARYSNANWSARNRNEPSTGASGE